jgi:hypothetical protein
MKIEPIVVTWLRVSFIINEAKLYESELSRNGIYSIDDLKRLSKEDLVGWRMNVAQRNELFATIQSEFGLGIGKSAMSETRRMERLKEEHIRRLKNEAQARMQ